MPRRKKPPLLYRRRVGLTVVCVLAAVGTVLFGSFHYTSGYFWLGLLLFGVFGGYLWIAVSCPWCYRNLGYEAMKGTLDEDLLDLERCPMCHADYDGKQPPNF